MRISDWSSDVCSSDLRERFGGTATGDPLYEAVSAGRRLAGMEHWLPLFEERLDTLFDHLGGNDLIVREAGTAPAADQRFEAIADYFQNREKAMSAESGSYRPLPDRKSQRLNYSHKSAPRM